MAELLERKRSRSKSGRKSPTTNNEARTSSRRKSVSRTKKEGGHTIKRARRSCVSTIDGLKQSRKYDDKQAILSVLDFYRRLEVVEIDKTLPSGIEAIPAITLLTERLKEKIGDFQYAMHQGYNEVSVVQNLTYWHRQRDEYYGWNFESLMNIQESKPKFLKVIARIIGLCIRMGCAGIDDYYGTAAEMLENDIEMIEYDIERFRGEECDGGYMATDLEEAEEMLERSKEMQAIFSDAKAYEIHSQKPITHQFISKLNPQTKIGKELVTIAKEFLALKKEGFNLAYYCIQQNDDSYDLPGYAANTGFWGSYTGLYGDWFSWNEEMQNMRYQEMSNAPMFSLGTQYYPHKRFDLSKPMLDRFMKNLYYLNRIIEKLNGNSYYNRKF